LSIGIVPVGALLFAIPYVVTTGQSFNFPTVAFQARLRDGLKTNADFQGQPAFADAHGKSVRLFVRK